MQVRPPSAQGVAEYAAPFCVSMCQIVTGIEFLRELRDCIGSFCVTAKNVA